MPYNESKKSKYALVEEKNTKSTLLFQSWPLCHKLNLRHTLCHNSNLRHTPYVTRPNCDLPSILKVCKIVCPYLFQLFLKNFKTNSIKLLEKKIKNKILNMSQVPLVTYNKDKQFANFKNGGRS